LKKKAKYANLNKYRTKPKIIYIAKNELTNSVVDVFTIASSCIMNI